MRLVKRLFNFIACYPGNRDMLPANEMAALETMHIVHVISYFLLYCTPPF